MSKKQQRSNREPKKPKQDKSKMIAPTSAGSTISSIVDKARQGDGGKK